jgi:hypothetical protein
VRAPLSVAARTALLASCAACASQEDGRPDFGALGTDASRSDGAHALDAAPGSDANADAGAEDVERAADAGFPSDVETRTDAGPPELRKAFTEHLGRLTGTARTPLEPIGLIGTDLGASFERDGRIVFLFGDSWLTGTDRARWDDDSAASTPVVFPSGGVLPALSWYLRGDGQFRSLLVPNVDLKPFNVPVEGFVHDRTTYVFFTTGYSFATGRHTHSVLAHETSADFGSFAVDHLVPSDKFLNLSLILHEGVFWIFGSGHYRRSAVHLAKVDPSEITDRGRWVYYRGLSNGAPSFGPDEASAMPIVPAGCVGELSARKLEALRLFLLAYNCDSPRGIHLRTAPSPSGPWSEPIVIFDPAPDRDRGYEYFIHAREDVVGVDDGLSEVGRENEWGGEYGPYLIPSWFTTVSPGVYSIAYVLSSWNPYQVHLMRTVLAESGVVVNRPERGVGLPRASLANGDFTAGLSGWQASGDPFTVFTGTDGRPRLTTFVAPLGDGAVGRMWQPLTVDSGTSEIVFSVHGGTGRVELHHGSEIVRSTHGRRTNDPETPVRWRISEYHGETLELVIVDDQTGPWGFIGTSGFELR